MWAKKEGNPYILARMAPELRNHGRRTPRGKLGKIHTSLTAAYSTNTTAFPVVLGFAFKKSVWMEPEVSFLILRGEADSRNKLREVHQNVSSISWVGRNYAPTESEGRQPSFTLLVAHSCTEQAPRVTMSIL